MDLRLSHLSAVRYGVWQREEGARRAASLAEDAVRRADSRGAAAPSSYDGRSSYDTGRAAALRREAESATVVGGSREAEERLRREQDERGRREALERVA